MRQITENNAYTLMTSSSAITQGKGIFETLLVVDGVPLYLGEHIGRINRSLEYLNIPQSIPIALAKDYIATLALDITQKYTLKISLYLCEDSIYWTIQATEDRYKNGIPWPIKVGFADYDQAISNPLNHLKTMNYWSKVHALELARSEGVDEVIFCNAHDDVLEGTRTNIFFYMNKVWFTPPVDSGILEGIARSWFIESLIHYGFKVEEAPISKHMAINADYVVVTNSLIGLSLATFTSREHLEQDHSIIQMLKSLQSDYRGGKYGKI